MSDRKPNDRYTHRRTINKKEPPEGESFFIKALDFLKNTTKKIGAAFASGYKKYDDFIRRIFKLGPPPDMSDTKNFGESYRDDDGLEELRSFTRQRNTEKNQDMSGLDYDDMQSTQRYDYVPDYLQKKTYDGPAPLADIEGHSREDHPQEHHWNIFKKRQKPRSFMTSVLVGLIKIVLALMLIMGTSGLGLIQGIANAYVDTTPELDLTKIENQDETSFIYDGNGNLVTSFVGLENRISASMDEVPDMLKSAFVAIEDERFYTHNGIDLKRIFGAFFNNLRTDSTQGGSTITTQLIKLRLLSSEQTYKRKIQEAYLAMELEKKYSKDEILVSYMNTINLGSGNYGVKAAARDYFGKELNELTIRESAMLASIANSSTLFNPRRNYERSNDRTDKTLYRMYRNGYISQDQYNAALTEQIFVIEESPKQQMYDMPYFLEYSIDDVVAHFIRQRNLDNNATNRNMIENELRTSGYHIYTTVDPVVQHSVEDSLYNWDRYPRMKYDSDSSVMVKNNDGSVLEVLQPQSAAVVFEYQTGQLKAIVGGRQEPQVKKALNRAIDSHMPVGSSIKPLAVYGPALNMGMSPSSVILDLPIPVEGWNVNSVEADKQFPNNYGGTFSGPVTMREALYRSINNAAARILLEHVGLDESYRTLETLGISSKYINKDGSGLALGTSDISVFEMAVAYGAIGNGGVYIEPVAFTKVVDSDGNILLDATAPSMQIRRTVFTAAANWLLVDMLKDVVKRGTGTNARIDDMTVAGKTGTNSDYRGVFFAGMTPYYSAALWIGHDLYKPLYRGSNGGSDAAPLWQNFMSNIHEQLDLPNKDIQTASPESLGLVKVTTCPVSGKLITDACLTDAAGLTPVTEWMMPESVPTEECDLHHTFRVCLTSGMLATPYCKEGSDTDPFSYVVIPSTHPAAQLSDEDFKEYFPSGLRGLPDDLLTFTYDNPEYRHLYCNIHTEEWYNNKVAIDNITSQSNQLADEVEMILITYNAFIDDEVKVLTNGALADMKEALKTQSYGPIAAAYTSLNTLKTTYLDPIVSSVVITPTPAPTPSETVSPTDSPSTTPSPTASAEG